MYLSEGAVAYRERITVFSRSYEPNQEKGSSPGHTQWVVEENFIIRLWFLVLRSGHSKIDREAVELALRSRWLKMTA